MSVCACEDNSRTKCQQIPIVTILESTQTASWDDLIKALNQIGEEETAEKVREEFCPSQPSGLADHHGDGNHHHHSNDSDVQGEYEVDRGIGHLVRKVERP